MRARDRSIVLPPPPPRVRWNSCGMNPRFSFLPYRHEYVRFSVAERENREGSLIRDHKRALLHNRNRLPVIVRQNWNRQWRAEGYGEYRATQRYCGITVYVRTLERKQCLYSIPSARPGMVLKPPMRLRYRWWLLLLIPYPCLAVTSRSAHIVGERAVVLRRFASAKGLSSCLQIGNTVRIRGINTAHVAHFFTRYDHNCFDVIVST